MTRESVRLGALFPSRGTPGADSDLVRDLVHRGYDERAGLILGPAGTPLARADIFEPEASPLLRAPFTAAYSRAWAGWFAASLKAPPGSSPEAFGAGIVSSGDRAALASGTAAGGGFIVPSDFSDSILSRVAAVAHVRPRATVMPTNRDSLVIPALSASADSAYATNARARWYGPGSQAESDPAFETMTIAVRHCRTPLILVDSDLARDAGGLLGWLSESGSRDLASAEDAGFVAGDGLAFEPRGLINSELSEIDIEGTSANTVSNTTSAAGSFPKLQGLVTSLPAQYRVGAVWLAAPNVEGAVAGLVDNAGRPLYERGRCENRPVLVSPFLEEQGTNGNRCVAFGDLSSYIVAFRSLSLRLLRERYADTDQLGVRLIERVGGGIWDTSAVLLGVV